MPEFSTEARELLAFANHEAQLLNHEYIGTEHLLLAMVRPNAKTWAGAILTKNGISLEEVDDLIRTYSPRGPDFVKVGRKPLTPRTERSLELAEKECELMGDSEVGTVHILIALVKDHEGVAGLVLDALRFNLARLNESLEQFRHMSKKDHEEPDCCQSEREPDEKTEPVETVRNGELNLSLPNGRELSITFPLDLTQKELCYLENMIEWTQNQPKPL